MDRARFVLAWMTRNGLTGVAQIRSPHRARHKRPIDVVMNSESVGIRLRQLDFPFDLVRRRVTDDHVLRALAGEVAGFVVVGENEILAELAGRHGDRFEPVRKRFMSMTWSRGFPRAVRYALVMSLL